MARLFMLAASVAALLAAPAIATEKLATTGAGLTVT